MFDVWLPGEDSLDDYHTESTKILVDFTASIVHVNSKISERNKTLINSICQDLMYFSSNGTIRTKKHAYLGLCYCISYNEVSKLSMFFSDTLFG